MSPSTIRLFVLWTFYLLATSAVNLTKVEIKKLVLDLIGHDMKNTNLVLLSLDQKIMHSRFCKYFEEVSAPFYSYELSTNFSIEEFIKDLEKIPKNAHVISIISSRHIRNVFTKFEERNIFHTSSKWLVLTNNSGKEQVSNILSMERKVFFLNSKSSNPSFIDVMRFSEEIQGLQKIGSWDAIQGYAGPALFNNRYPNLKNKIYRIGFKDHYPFIADVTRKNGTFTVGEGIDYRIMKTIAEKLKFRTEYVESIDGEWGAKNNETWSGLFGMMQRKELDMAVTGLTITTVRLQNFDFSITYLSDKLKFVTKMPSDKVRLFLALAPFAKPVWYAFTASLIVISFILFLMDFGYDKLIHDNDKWESDKLSLIQESYWQIFRAAVHQSGRISTRTGNRIIIACWWLFAVTIMASYGAKLTSLMTIPSKADKINTVQKLQRELKTDNYFCGTIRGTYVIDLIQTANQEFYKTINNRCNHGNNYMVNSVEEGLHQVKQGKYAFLFDFLFIKGRINQSEEYVFSEDTLQSSPLAIAMKKGFPYLDTFNDIIRRLHHGGFINHWMKELWEGRNEIKQTETPDPVIRMQHLESVFYLLFLGYMLSLVSFVIEISYKTKLKKNS